MVLCYILYIFLNAIASTVKFIICEYILTTVKSNEICHVYHIGQKAANFSWDIYIL